MGLTLTDQTLMDSSHRHLPHTGTVQVVVFLPPSPLQLGTVQMLTQAEIPFLEMSDTDEPAFDGVRALLTDAGGVARLNGAVPKNLPTVILAEPPIKVVGNAEVVSPLEDPVTIINRLITFADITPPRPLLTVREREILALAAAGLANTEIGERCYVAPTTVKTHLQSVFRKLDVPDRTSAVYRALKLGIIA